MTTVRPFRALRYDPDNPGGKILLGALNGRLIGVADDRHICTIAGSRAGKGVSAIVPNLILYDGSVLAIDPGNKAAKQGLAEATGEVHADRETALAPRERQRDRGLAGHGRATPTTRRPGRRSRGER